MKIVLVRHGYSQGNHEGTYSGWTDVVLTKSGIKELQEFKESHLYPETDRYISSSLTRCVQTFNELFSDKHQLHEVSDDLREVFFGDYENLKGSEVSPNFFIGFSNNERTANGETLSEFTYRIISKLEQIMFQLQEDGLDSVTVVCHSGVIKAILMFLDNLPFTDFGKIETKNGLGYVLDVELNQRLRNIKLLAYHAIAKKA